MIIQLHPIIWAPLLILALIGFGRLLYLAIHFFREAPHTPNESCVDIPTEEKTPEKNKLTDVELLTLEIAERFVDDIPELPNCSCGNPVQLRFKRGNRSDVNYLCPTYIEFGTVRHASPRMICEDYVQVKCDKCHSHCRSELINYQWPLSFANCVDRIQAAYIDAEGKWNRIHQKPTKPKDKKNES